MTEPSTTATTPEDVSRLLVDSVNAGDADAAAALYEPDAVLGFPPGGQTIGRAAIREVYVKIIESGAQFPHEQALPTVRAGELALTSTVAQDGTGGRVQVLRRQPDGAWLRVLDRPETT